jgi:hypothetical protein
LYVLPQRTKRENGQIVYDYALKYHKEHIGYDPPKKRMLANLCDPSLVEDMVEVRIVDVDQFGNRLSDDHWYEAYTIAIHSFDRRMVPTWTQSGVKAGSFKMITQEAFAKLGRRFSLESGGFTFGAYIGLLFSDLGPFPICRVPAVWSEPRFGEDGDGTISRALFGKYARQVRLIVLDEDGWPKLLGKGVLTPVASLDGATNPAVLNDTLIKWAHGITAEDQIIIAPTMVWDQALTIPLTWGALVMLRNVPEVRAMVEQKAEEAAYELCSLLNDRERVALLKRLGQLRVDAQGDLVRADRNILSMIRSAMPWCEEMETRLNRVFLRELTERIAPSAGIMGRGYLATQHSKLGARPCEWTDDVKCIAWRLPCTSVDNIVPFDRKLRNGLVHPEVMAAMAGDSDGDYIVVCTDPDVIAAFKAHRMSYHAGGKPQKNRGEAPLSREFQIENGAQVHADGALIGRLTMVAHHLLINDDLDLSAKAGFYAQAVPMLAKYPGLSIDGQPFRSVIAPFLAIKCDTPHWRTMQREAKRITSVRELAGFHIEEPQSLVDYSFNATFKGVRRWLAENPLKPLSLPIASMFAFEAHGVDKARISIQDVQWRRKLVSLWGQYWEKYYAKAVSHKPWLDAMRDIGNVASISQLVALLRWTPRTGTSSGFNLKYHVVGTNWEKLLGLHPSVAEFLNITVEERAVDTLVRAVAKAMVESEIDQDQQAFELLEL